MGFFIILFSTGTYAEICTKCVESENIMKTTKKYLHEFLCGLFIVVGRFFNLVVPQTHLGVQVDLELGVGLLHLLGGAQVRVHALTTLLKLKSKKILILAVSYGL